MRAVLGSVQEADSECHGNLAPLTGAGYGQSRFRWLSSLLKGPVGSREVRECGWGGTNHDSTRWPLQIGGLAPYSHWPKLSGGLRIATANRCVFRCPHRPLATVQALKSCILNCR